LVTNTYWHITTHLISSSSTLQIATLSQMRWNIILVSTKWVLTTPVGEVWMQIFHHSRINLAIWTIIRCQTVSKMIATQSKQAIIQIVAKTALLSCIFSQLWLLAQTAVTVQMVPISKCNLLKQVLSNKIPNSTFQNGLHCFSLCNQPLKTSWTLNKAIRIMWDKSLLSLASRARWSQPLWQACLVMEMANQEEMMQIAWIKIKISKMEPTFTEQALKLQKLRWCETTPNILCTPLNQTSSEQDLYKGRNARAAISSKWSPKP